MSEHVSEWMPKAAMDPRLAGRLALLLTDPDDLDAGDLLAVGGALVDSIPRLYGHLFEPAARVMGDLWLADECEDWQVTLGMCRLLTLSHDVAVAQARRPSAPLQRSVLVVSQPGETHLLVAALHAELFWRAGWQVRHETPGDDDELVALVAHHGFDLLDIGLSAAYRRDDWLPRMARTVAGARAASHNDELAVMVSGRRFYEDASAAARVGADGRCPVSFELPAIADAMWQRSSAFAERP